MSGRERRSRFSDSLEGKDLQKEMYVKGNGSLFLAKVGGNIL